MAVLSVLMFSWSTVFLMLAIIASVVGFGGLAGVPADVGRVFAVIFLVLLVLTLILEARSYRK